MVLSCGTLIVVVDFINDSVFFYLYIRGRGWNLFSLFHRLLHWPTFPTHLREVCCRRVWALRSPTRHLMIVHTHTHDKTHCCASCLPLQQSPQSHSSSCFLCWLVAYWPPLPECLSAHSYSQWAQTHIWRHTPRFNNFYRSVWFFSVHDRSIIFDRRLLVRLSS